VVRGKRRRSLDAYHFALQEPEEGDVWKTTTTRGEKRLEEKGELTAALPTRGGKKGHTVAAICLEEGKARLFIWE